MDTLENYSPGGSGGSDQGGTIGDEDFEDSFHLAAAWPK